MKLIKEIKSKLKELSKSLLKDIIAEPEIEEKSEREEILIFEEGKGSFSFELEESEEKKEDIEEIINLLKKGEYDMAIENIKKLKFKKGFRIERDEIEL